MSRKLIALNWFISKATDKCHIFFWVIKKEKKTGGHRSANRHQ